MATTSANNTYTLAVPPRAPLSLTHHPTLAAAGCSQAGEHLGVFEEPDLDSERLGQSSRPPLFRSPGPSPRVPVSVCCGSATLRAEGEPVVLEARETRVAARRSCVLPSDAAQLCANVTWLCASGRLDPT